MKSREDVIKGLECCIDYKCDVCHYGDDGGAEDGCCSYELKKDVLALLKAQEPVEANCEHRCNKCKFYEGVHNVMGHAPCSLWEIGGVMWNDYCSRFNLWKESEV